MLTDAPRRQLIAAFLMGQVHYNHVLLSWVPATLHRDLSSIASLATAKALASPQSTVSSGMGTVQKRTHGSPYHTFLKSMLCASTIFATFFCPRQHLAIKFRVVRPGRCALLTTTVVAPTSTIPYQIQKSSGATQQPPYELPAFL